MTPTPPKGEILLGCKIGVFLSIFSSLFLGTDQKIEYIVMMTKECKFQSHVAGGFVLGRGHVSHVNFYNSLL